MINFHEQEMIGIIFVIVVVFSCSRSEWLKLWKNEWIVKNAIFLKREKCWCFFLDLKDWFLNVFKLESVHNYKYKVLILSPMETFIFLFLKKKFLCQDISPYNTRLFKTVSKDGKVTYQLRLASAAKSGEQKNSFYKKNAKYCRDKVS